ncbi:MAG: hypothetical protein AAGB25_03070 [Pseudomonadota bacterium]
MSTVTDYFDPAKSFEAFTKYTPTEMFKSPQFKAMGDFYTKAREVGVDAMNRNVDLTMDWFKDAQKDAEALMKPEGEPAEYMKKAGEMAVASMNALPSRMFAYAEVAKKAQFDMLDTVLGAAQPALDAATPAPAKKTRKANGAA